MTHWNRAAIDSLNEIELRIITTPDGTRRPFTAAKWLWREHDYVVNYFTDKENPAAWIIELSWSDAERTNRPFGKLYPVLIQFLANHIRTQPSQQAAGAHGTA